MVKLKKWAIILVAMVAINMMAMEEEKPNPKESEEKTIHSLKLMCAKAVIQNWENIKTATANVRIDSGSLDYLRAIESVDNHIKKLEEAIEQMISKNDDRNPIFDLQSYYSAKKLKKDCSLIDNHRSLLYKLIESDNFTYNSETIISMLDNFSIIKICYHAFGALDIDKMNLLVTLLTTSREFNNIDRETKLILKKIACEAIKEDLDLCRLLAYNNLIPKLEYYANDDTKATFFMHALANCKNPKILPILLKLGLTGENADSYWNNLLNLKTNYNETILHSACYENNIEFIFNLAKHHKLDITHLINTQNDDGYTPLIIAIRNSHDKAVEILIKNGADINLTWHNRTPLNYAQIILRELLSTDPSNYESPEALKRDILRANNIIKILKDELYESCATMNSLTNYRCITM